MILSRRALMGLLVVVEAFWGDERPREAEPFFEVKEAVSGELEVVLVGAPLDPPESQEEEVSGAVAFYLSPDEGHIYEWDEEVQAERRLVPLMEEWQDEEGHRFAAGLVDATDPRAERELHEMLAAQVGGREEELRGTLAESMERYNGDVWAIYAEHTPAQERAEHAARLRRAADLVGSVSDVTTAGFMVETPCEEVREVLEALADKLDPPEDDAAPPATGEWQSERERVADAYRQMAAVARYRPAAPSDGLGNITVPLARLDLDAEARKYAEGFVAEEDTRRFFIGVAKSALVGALVYAVETARLACVGRGAAAAALPVARLAVAELEREARKESA